MSRKLSLTILSFLGVIALSVGIARAPRSAPPVVAGAGGMTDASMRQWLAEWYGAHPAHGGATTAGTPSDTFLVSNFIFDTDHNLGTQVDTAKVLVGQSVLFKWVAGFHTTTSGNPPDLDAGSHWDHPIDPSNVEFAVQYDTAGTYPFFCRPHGAAFNMRGVVVVSPNNTGVSPAQPLAGRVGFLQRPWPNPSAGGTNFHFAIGRPGTVSLRVLDVGGRVITTLLDQSLDAGAYASIWNGRRADGSAAAAGIYYAQLRAPGISTSERIVIEH